MSVMAAMETLSMRYDDKEMDEESLRMVKEELNETEENKERYLDVLKKKLMDQEDLNPCLQEDFLLAFLRVAKYDFSKAYQRIIRYYEERSNLPEIFNDYLPSSVKIAEKARQLFACPYRMRDNSAIMIVKRCDYSPTEVPYDLILRALSMIGDLIIQHPVNQMCGFTVLMDLGCSSWSSWSELTPTRMKLLARLVQKSVALRIRNIHVINAPPIYFLLYSVVYPFLSTKMRNRVVLHKNYASLHSYIDPELLPKEYEGDLDHSDLISMFERLYAKEDFFHKFSKYGFIKRRK